MKVPNVETATFGRPNRPQTPVGGIIHHGFQNAAEQDLQQKYVIWQEVVSFSPPLTNTYLPLYACLTNMSSVLEKKL